MTEQDSMELARQLAAQAWCLETTSHIEMDVAVAEAFAAILNNWIETARSFAKGQDFYHGIVVKCGEMLGPAVYVSDDGSIQDSVLALKVPEVLADALGSCAGHPNH